MSLQLLGKCFIRLKHTVLRFSRRFKNQTTKLSQKKLQNTTINFPKYIFGAYTPILPGFFFHSFCCRTFANCMNREGLTFSMFHFLETGIKEQKKYEKRIQTAVDNSVNDLRYEIKFASHVKDKNITFLLRKTLLFFITFFFLLKIIYNREAYFIN